MAEVWVTEGQLQNVVSLWSMWSVQRRIILIGAVALAFGLVFAIARMAATPTMDLLYAGLDANAAGSVVSALDAQGVAYEVRGGSIYVEQAQRDRLRMTLASEGLPANGAKGYELLDGLSGFGTTAQMFDAAYWRAKEGEIARTITASPAVRSARVLIANPPRSPFQRDVRPTASVHIQSATGMLSIDQARAFQYLVGSAVAGLQPDDVAIIDTEAGLIETNSDQSPALTANNRAEALRERALRILEARVGAGNAQVEVSVETVTATEEIVERRFNPEERVPISTDTESRSSQSQEEGAAGVTVASNLPEGDVGAEDSSSRQENETRERVNYEVSETRREVRRVPGDIARISVAVLVNGTVIEGEGMVPRSAEELDALAELVSAAIGINENRGDDITIRSLVFVDSEVETLAAQPTGFMQALDVMALIQLAALVLVALVLALFVLRPLLLRSSEPQLALAGAAGAPALGEGDSGPEAIAGDDGPTAISGEVADEEDDFELPQLGVVADFDTSDLPDGDGSFDLPDLSDLDDDPVARLKELIQERPRETIELLRSWIEEDEA